MKNFRPVLDQLPLFDTISRIAAGLDMESYVVGGYVRDLLLERPSKDIDVVCVGDGITLAKAVAKAIDKEKKGKPTSVNYFKNFGTAQLKNQDWEVEFVGARKESYNRNSRKPIVENGTLEDDQKTPGFYHQCACYQPEPCHLWGFDRSLRWRKRFKKRGNPYTPQS